MLWCSAPHIDILIQHPLAQFDILAHLFKPKKFFVYIDQEREGTGGGGGGLAVNW